LKKPAILEVCPSGSNTLFSRRDVLHGVGERTMLPAIAAARPARVKLKDSMTICGPADMFTGLGRVTCQLVTELGKHHTVHFQTTSVDRRLPLPAAVDEAAQLFTDKRSYPHPRLVISPLLDIRKHLHPGDTLLTMWESTVLPPGSTDTINTYASQLIVPSSWCATVFSANGVTVPIKIVPLGIDTSVYKPSDKPKKRVHPSSVVFGAAGRLAHGGKRKGIEDVIAAFKLAFPGGEIATLELKLFDDCYIPAFDDNRINVLTRTITDREMAAWYNTLDCFVSLSKGEGWGLHVQEAMACGVPVIAPSYSGLADMVKDGVPYQLIPATEGYLGHWCQPSIDCAAAAMEKFPRFYTTEPWQLPISLQAMADNIKAALC
jgi:glycosyltransferase involved in cell wall biosynthesis